MNQRYYSLDVFRGATVALMILVNNPGSWAHIYSPLEHASWHGVTPTDLVFPFFLFAVGNSLAFVMPRLRASAPTFFWKKITIRSLLIFGIGVFLAWWPFFQWIGANLVFKGWTWTGDDGLLHGIRVMGVLQRIALSYFLGSIIIYYLKPPGIFLAALIILLFYWLFCLVTNPADPYSLTGWFGKTVDINIFGEAHIYHGELLNGKPYPFDPEGLISTLPSVVQVIFGFLIGDYIRKRGLHIQQLNENHAVKGLEIYQTVSVLFIAAVALLFTGYMWGLSFPLNKKIWTSSFVVYTSGLAVLILATLIYAIEIKKMQGWLSRFFEVFGKNALFIFALSSFLPRTLALIRWPDHIDNLGKTVYLDPWHWLYQKIYINIPGVPENGSLGFALTVIIIFWSICYWMNKKKIYIKV